MITFSFKHILFSPFLVSVHRLMKVAVSRYIELLCDISVGMKNILRRDSKIVYLSGTIR
jgi:hypothetical protein